MKYETIQYLDNYKLKTYNHDLLEMVTQSSITLN